VALATGRADIIVRPTPNLSSSPREKKIKRVVTLSVLWQKRSDVAITTRKGLGQVDTLTLATNGLIKSGAYANFWSTGSYRKRLSQHREPIRSACRRRESQAC